MDFILVTSEAWDFSCGLWRRSAFGIVESSEAHRFTTSLMLAGPFDMFDSTNTVLIQSSAILLTTVSHFRFCHVLSRGQWYSHPLIQTASGSDPGLAMADPVLTWAPNERCGSRSGMQRVSLKQTPQKMLGGIPVATSMALFISIDGIYILYNIIHIHMSYTCKGIYIYDTHVYTHIQTYRHADMQTYRHTDRQTYTLYTHCIHTVYTL